VSARGSQRSQATSDAEDVYPASWIVWVAEVLRMISVGAFVLAFFAVSAALNELRHGWCQHCGARLTSVLPRWTGPWWEPRRFAERRCVECQPLGDAKGNTITPGSESGST